MNINKLTTKYVSFGVNYYTPDDPFFIYQRLLTLYLTTKTNMTEINSNYPFGIKDAISLQKPLKLIDTTHRNIEKHELIPFQFLVFIYQNIPTEFWKFNINIDGTIGSIREAMKNHDGTTFWVDMPGKKNKVKPVIMTPNVYDEIKNGTLNFPDYDTICSQVYNWGNKTKYAFGMISSLYPKG
jgi:hypothetical protein